MVYRPADTQLFEFVVTSALRAAQLMRGSTPRVTHASRPTITAQREVAVGAVRPVPRAAHEAAHGPRVKPEFNRVNRNTDSGRDVNRSEVHQMKTGYY